MRAPDRLRQKAAAYQRKAEGLLLAAEELESDGTEKAKASLNGKLDSAIKLRRAIKHHRPKKQPLKREKGALVAAALYVLNQAKSPLSTDELRSRIEEKLGEKIGAAGFGSLVRYGYARQTKDGYVGTGKAPKA